MNEQRNGEPWREWLQREVRGLEKDIANLEEKIDLQINARDKNLRGQAREYERRLDAGDESRGRIEARLAETIGRKKYTDDREADRDALDRLKTQVIEAAGERAGREIEKTKVLTTRLSAVALIVSLVSLIMGWF